MPRNAIEGCGMQGSQRNAMEYKGMLWNAKEYQEMIMQL